MSPLRAIKFYRRKKVYERQNKNFNLRWRRLHARAANIEDNNNGIVDPCAGELLVPLEIRASGNPI